VSRPPDRVSPRARLRLAANLSLLYAERPFLERFRAAAACGFTAVECQFPYDHPPAAIASELRRHEPGTGTVDWPALVDAMVTCGWQGWIGAEYVPADAAAGGTEAGLGWIECLGLRRRAADLQKADR